MLKTEREKRICAKYSAPDEDGYVHCYECPLRVDTDTTDVGCKAWMHYDRRLRDWVPDHDNGDDTE